MKEISGYVCIAYWGRGQRLFGEGNPYCDFEAYLKPFKNMKKVNIAKRELKKKFETVEPAKIELILAENTRDLELLKREKSLVCISTGLEENSEYSIYGPIPKKCTIYPAYPGLEYIRTQELLTFDNFEKAEQLRMELVRQKQAKVYIGSLKIEKLAKTKKN